MLPKVTVQSNSLPRADGVTDRLVVVGLGGRFFDELLSGLPMVLMPTIRATLGLSYSQVGLLSLALSYVAAVVEPVNGLLIDVWRRRWLMAWGAAAVGLATAFIGLAPSYPLLLIAFAIYGLGSGPLAHTADVVLVDAHPETPDRIFARASMLDTVGAMLAPLSVTLVFWLGLEWRWLLVALGLSSLAYAGLILRTHFPQPRNGHHPVSRRLIGTFATNLKTVLSNRVVRSWLAFHLVLYALESPFMFSSIWLREEVGMSQALIGLYTAGTMVAYMASLAFLERWLKVRMRSGRRLMQIAGLILLALYPAWLFWPGVAPRFILGLLLAFFFGFYWPVAQGRTLASVPGLGGTVTAVLSLFGLIPMELLFGLLAEAIGLTTAMLWVWLPAQLLLLLVIARQSEP
jgi:MFS family permease